MSYSDRKDKIYTMVQKRMKVSVCELADYFNVTQTTIRRDLLKLEESGLVRRSRGFAHAIEDTNRKMTPDLFAEEKKRIALKALSYVRSGMSIALDTGTTVQNLANLIAERQDLENINIITNSLFAGIILADYYTVNMPGGYVLGPNNYSLVGVSVENFFKNVNADIAFLASTGVFNSNGLTVSYPSHLDVKKNMVKCATKKIALLDSSKFVGRGIFNFCSFEELDTIITVGTESNARELKRIADLGVEIILV